MFVDEWGIRTPCGASIANCRQSSIAVIVPRSKTKLNKNPMQLSNRSNRLLPGGNPLAFFDFVYGTEKYRPRCINSSLVPCGSVRSVSFSEFVIFSSFPKSPE
jgi:hypothetical protein